MDLKDLLSLLYPPALFAQLSAVHGPVLASGILLLYFIAIISLVIGALYLKKRFLSPKALGKEELDKSLAVFSQQLMTVMGEVARRFEPHLTNAQVDVILEIYFKIISLSMVQLVMECSKFHKENMEETREQLEAALSREIEKTILAWDSNLKKLPEAVYSSMIPSQLKIDQTKELVSDMANMAEHQSTYHHINTVLGSKLEYVMLKWKAR